MEPDETTPETTPPATPPTPEPAAPQFTPLEQIGEADSSLTMIQAKAAAAILSKVPGLAPEQAIVLARAQHADIFAKPETPAPETTMAKPVNPNPQVSPTRSTPTPPPRQLSPAERAEVDNLETSRRLIREADTMADSERHGLAVQAERAYRARRGLPVTEQA